MKPHLSKNQFVYVLINIVLLICLITISPKVYGIMMVDAQNYEFSEEIEYMIDVQLIERGIKDEKVLSAFRKTPRHLFVPTVFRSEAYGDYPLHIGSDQTISQPYIVALMSELGLIKEDDICLEIGTGSGYQASILSRLCKKVYSIEIISKLSKKASLVIEKLDLKNIKLKVGDGYEGWPEHSPFDVILVTAAPEEIPNKLIEQLAEGGRLILPLGAQDDVQTLKRITLNNGELYYENFGLVRFVPMVFKDQ